MRLNDILTESQQQELHEGPLLNKFGSAVAKGVGTAAKGVGAVAGGVAGIGKAVKKGYQAGKTAVGGAGDTAAPVSAPEKSSGVLGKIGKAVGDFKSGFAQGQGTAAPADTTAAPTATSAAPAANTTAPAANPEAEKAAKIGVGQINKIIPTLRTRDLMSLQTNLEKTIASKKKAAPAAPPADAAQSVAPAADVPAPAGSKFTYGTADGQPEVWTKTAKGWSSDGSTADRSYSAEIEKAYKQSRKKKAAPSQATIDADRERNIGITSDSVIRTSASLSETLLRKVQEQKQRMFETALMSGTQSVFKK